MLQRNRSKKAIALSGYVKDSSGNILGTSYVDSPETITMDFWQKKVREDGTLPPSDFERKFIERMPYVMNRSTGTFRFQAEAILPGFTPDLGDPYKARGSSARQSENDWYVQELLSRTNPFRPEFSVPVFTKELVEIASMFSLAAKTFAGYAGGAYLNYRFGWLAFVRDIRTLHGITTAISRRMKELNSLSKHGGIRRKITLDTKSYEWSGSNLTMYSSWSTSVKGSLTSKRTMVVTGSVRWRATQDFAAQLVELDRFNFAVKKVFDLEKLDAETVWQMLPFSWLADYFVNISAYLGNYAGENSVEPYDICIMRHFVSREQYQVTSKPTSVSIAGQGTYILDVKARDVCQRGLFPVVRTDLLNRNQWLVVAALFARFRG